MIMQNKPNFQNAQMNASYCFTMNCEQITMNNANKNKPNQTQHMLFASESGDGSFYAETEYAETCLLFEKSAKFVPLAVRHI